MGEGDRALAIHITGRVQGVGFRAWMRGEAQRLGITGWVANREAGHVEAVIAGPGDRLGELVTLCRRGPSAAQVDHVDVRSTDRGAASAEPADALPF